MCSGLHAAQNAMHEEPLVFVQMRNFFTSYANIGRVRFGFGLFWEWMQPTKLVLLPHTDAHPPAAPSSVVTSHCRRSFRPIHEAVSCSVPTSCGYDQLAALFTDCMSPSYVHSSGFEPRIAFRTGTGNWGLS